MGGSRKDRFWPAWDEAQQSLVGKKPLVDIARALQPSPEHWLAPSSAMCARRNPQSQF